MNLEIQIYPGNDNQKLLVIAGINAQLGEVCLPSNIAEFIKSAVEEKIRRDNATNPLLHSKVKTINRFKSISGHRWIESGTLAEVVAVYQSKHKGTRISIRINNSFNVSTSIENLTTES